MSDFTDFPNFDNFDLLELQLQQELQAMFDVDSQQYLQDYLHLAQHLNSQSWTADVREMYRLIHTIKGGSVTVGADACLRVAAVLEDLLSDLRHLTPAPFLEDGQLAYILQEAGELLASTLQTKGSEETIATLVQPSVERVQALHEQIKTSYLSDWSEQRLLHQEFADQGFELVVLTLEMAVSRLSISQSIPDDTLKIATQTLAQLAEIGRDLGFAEGWIELLDRCDTLVNNSFSEKWRSQWPGYLTALQESARQGGKFIEPIFIPISSLPGPATESNIELSAEVESLAFEPLLQNDSDFFNLELGSLEINDFVLDTSALDNLSFEDIDPISFDLDSTSLNLEQHSDLTPPIEDYTIEIDLNLQEVPEIDEISSIQSDWSSPNNLPDFDELDNLADLDGSEDLLGLTNFSTLDEQAAPFFEEITIEPSEGLGLASPAPARTRSQKTAEPKRDRQPDLQINNVQIPVPLERLDRTSQTLVETLLSVRATQGLYDCLQSQLVQLLALAQESTQYITELRELQDSYALLNDLESNRQATEGPTLERYRQGYNTINRLLETSLRLSELGAEASKSARQTSTSLKTLDRSVLRLRSNVEQSRLVPFKNLGFRARAVLRDLTTRIGKPAQILIQGEQIELDAATASKLEPALLHLIRNAYDHGLENSKERVASGKPEQGSITLSLRRSGSRYLLELKDDGRGIDADYIRQSAEAKGLSLTQTETSSKLLSVLCQPGFSSQDVVSDISGRGVGMDVVAHQIEALGGRLQLETTVGIGSTFQLQFPVPQLLVSCVQLQVGDRIFAIPAQDIATTALWDSLQTIAVENTNHLYSWQIEQGETLFPGLDLMDYWQPKSISRSIPDTAIALHIRSTEQDKSLWILVDDLIGQTELLITPLPSPLEAPIGILGVSLQNDGSLVPVIDAALLAEVLSQPTLESSVLALSFSSATPPEPNVLPSADRTILVVDDAALMRRRIEVSLAAHGYTIVTCADGQEAWNWLQSHSRPAMAITDIEMPNMDGFTLIDRVRQAGIAIPIIVVSSRLAEDWSKEAQRLGATDYLTKGFTTQELVSKVKSLL